MTLAREKEKRHLQEKTEKEYAEQIKLLAQQKAHYDRQQRRAKERVSKLAKKLFGKIIDI